MDANASPSTLYFGYGSNLWLEQMDTRCPTSTYLGVGRLPGYRWMINSRGYANVVQTAANATTETEDEVYGLVYRLFPNDEKRLDLNEGVPYAYTKEDMPIQFWSPDPDRQDGWCDVAKPHEELPMLVYIDRERVRTDSPKAEYIVRMNRGIKDAIAMGVPEEYVKKVMRRFIPAKNDRIMEETARRQSLQFENEL
ncbi:hypothetical protein K490DRAFT_70829 [Saccharata proteae CBS 121410]|uniref:gamma-glutamylcyclotransferase n=1 Tax=Saccharata proteae CBS 121410 TaxID=1314787 RepID=A0A9P4I4X2_9PEZI|nr:hypothetical protein K490DRAFT_70829 [Saccharata proteae CBS 121410]